MVNVVGGDCTAPPGEKFHHDTVELIGQRGFDGALDEQIGTDRRRLRHFTPRNATVDLFIGLISIKTPGGLS